MRKLNGASQNSWEKISALNNTFQKITQNANYPENRKMKETLRDKEDRMTSPNKHLFSLKQK